MASQIGNISDILSLSLINSVFRSKNWAFQLIKMSQSRETNMSFSIGKLGLFYKLSLSIEKLGFYKK